MEQGRVERSEANGDCTVSWVIHNVDCLDFLRTLPAGSVDAVVTDPPYGIEWSGHSASTLDWNPIANDTGKLDLRPIAAPDLPSGCGPLPCCPLP